MSVNHNNEEWRAIPGFDGYEVSNYGRVRSYRRSYIDGPHILKQMKHGSRGFKHWYKVALCKDSKAILCTVHSLVLLAFVGPCPEGMECCHANGYGHDNRLDNLSWGTRKQNRADGDRNERSVIGSRHKNAKLTESSVVEIRRLAATETLTSIGKRYGIALSTVWRIVNGEDWKHVT